MRSFSPVLVAAAAATAIAPSQAPALLEVHRVLPGAGAHPPARAIGDVNGDGTPDVVFVGHERSSRVWLGGSDSVFTARDDAFPVIAEMPRAIVLIDVDADGDRDVVCATDGIAGTVPQTALGLDRVFVNDGTGRFTLLATPSFGNGPSSSIAAADLDGDGDQDLVIGHPTASQFFGPHNDEVCINDGNGNFTSDPQRIPGIGPGTNSLVLFDRDGDGDADLYCGNTWGLAGGPPPFGTTMGDQLFLNDGNGWFTAAALTQFNGNTTRHVAAADFDGDGDRDLLTVESVPMFSDGVHYRRNDGASFTSFVVPAPAVPGPIAELLLGDWNGDGNLDYGVRRSGNVYTYVQSAPASFTASVLAPIDTGDLAVFAFDADADGDTDVLAPANYIQGPLTAIGARDSQWFRNLGTAWSTLPAPPLPPLPLGSGAPVELVDIDLDGDLDAVRAPQFCTGAIFRNDGTGSFAPAVEFATPIHATIDPVFGDVDADGDVDIVLAVRDEPYTVDPFVQLFRNVNGSFVGSQLAPVNGERAVLGDFDGDNDLDLVLTNHVLWNDGTGAFTPMPSTGLNAHLGSLFAADLDGDGDLDVGCYTHAQQFHSGYLRNDGGGVFTQVPIPGLASHHVVAADFDRDLDVDLLEVGHSSTSHRLLTNSGTGTFTASIVPTPPGSSFRLLVVADLDGDAWPDIVEVDRLGPTHGYPPPRILRNDQAGGFTSVTGSVVGVPIDFFGTAVGDVDGDSDVDLLIASPTTMALLRNLHHQVAWYALPRVGHPLRLDLFGRANETCVLGVAFAPAAIPLPGLGTLWLDPASLLVIAVGSYDANGLGVFTASVPNVPSLVGASLYWQALSGFTHLGNLEVTTLQAP